MCTHAAPSLFGGNLELALSSIRISPMCAHARLAGWTLIPLSAPPAICFGRHRMMPEMVGSFQVSSKYWNDHSSLWLWISQRAFHLGLAEWCHAQSDGCSFEAPSLGCVQKTPMVNQACEEVSQRQVHMRHHWEWPGCLKLGGSLRTGDDVVRCSIACNHFPTCACLGLCCLTLFLAVQKLSWAVAARPVQITPICIDRMSPPRRLLSQHGKCLNRVRARQADLALSAAHENQ